MLRAFVFNWTAIAVVLGPSGLAGASEHPIDRLQAEERPQAEESAWVRPPGATGFSDGLGARLWSAYQAKGSDYEPRTELLRPNGSPLHVNRLILEDSPYLLQHAHNPVDWHPWGADAFEKARREDKPIFLSIGYSTCHWCHVMERESFDNAAVARVMNQHFISIKVDREQRPDVDDVYMTAVQLLTGRGGWPMSSFLDFEGRPFFGGTYYPEATFVDLLQQVAAAWRDRRPQLLEQAEKLAEAVGRATAAAGETVEVGTNLIDIAVERSLARHDSRLGGFSGAPKFPHEAKLLFLLDRALRLDDERVLAAVETSLDHMARGGIYDQIGGGFHRYSTDAEWLVPHFEKMLYNQAHLGRAYLEAAALTGDPSFERVARQTLDYVLRDMTSPAGAFYSATDADSEEREGEFFVWTPAEIRAVLVPADAELALRVFGITEEGNFEGKNIPHLPKPLPAVASELGLPLGELFDRVDRIRQQLYEVRETREHPLRDEKTVTAWNAMMASTLARAGGILGEDRYLEAAMRATDFLWWHNRRPDGRLWRIHLDGNSSVEATLNDYVYLMEALIVLYDATGERRWLERCRSLAEITVERFWDDVAGGFFVGEGDHGGRLPVRPKSPIDGAVPSGNSVAVRALALLSRRSDDPSYRRTAEASLAAFSGLIHRSPDLFSYMLLGAEELLAGSAGPLEYGARGVVRARASITPGSGGTGALEVVLRIADGWHVNSDRPLQDELIPTRLVANGSDWTLSDVTYPAARRVTLGFQDEPLAVLDGVVPIRAALEHGTGDPPSIVRLELTIQACDDRRCLRPEDLSLELPPPR
ncbi:MAG: DUF255 domain-containing protein [Thermoanaerobaculia bacterium]